MKHCEHCKVEVNSRCSRCPLCGCELVGENSAEPAFPELIRKKKHTLLVKLMALLTVIAAVVCVAINLTVDGGGWWSAFAIAGFVSAWISLAVVIKKHNNITKTIVWQVAIASALAVLWDVFTGYRGWAIDYVLPLSCCGAMTLMWIIARIMRLRIEDYIVYLIIDIIFGIIPMILMLCGVVDTLLPSVICVGLSVISLAALLIFEGKALRAELTRRMHL